jgi:hypothetical protein
MGDNPAFDRSLEDEFQLLRRNVQNRRSGDLREPRQNDVCNATAYTDMVQLNDACDTFQLTLPPNPTAARAAHGLTPIPQLHCAQATGYS